jgi:hypothetical protein
MNTKIIFMCLALFVMLHVLSWCSLKKEIKPTIDLTAWTAISGDAVNSDVKSIDGFTP